MCRLEGNGIKLCEEKIRQGKKIEKLIEKNLRKYGEKGLYLDVTSINLPIHCTGSKLINVSVGNNEM